MVTPKVWLVTGASSGLGLAITLAALQAGQSVIACARNVEKAAKNCPEVEAKGGRWLQLDVTSSDATKTVEQAIEGEGRIDVVVNNAGHCRAGSLEDLSWIPSESLLPSPVILPLPYEQLHLTDYSLAEISSQFDVVYYGAIRVLKACIPRMRTQKSGTVISMSSVFGFSPYPGCLAYNSAKFALEGLTETLALDLAGFGMNFVILEPGLFKTNILVSGKLPEAGLSQAYADGPVGETFGLIGEIVNNPDETMFGDANKLGQRVVELVERTGMAKNVPREPSVLRLPLGPDGIARCKKKARELAENFETVEAICMSTNFERFGEKAALRIF
ncbi:hypothetical protein LTR50_006077 [Elasticomyces elasticus]|nr:hypothetical protein LTR50_006077 [Elasticomyces elasticus]